MMMTEYAPILLFMFSTSFTPGPNNFMLLNSGLHHGIQKSLPHYFGVCLGFFMMVLIVALGFGEVFLHYPWLKQILKVVGSVYMFYLAVQVLLAHTRVKAGGPARPLSFMQAVLFQWVNPKAWIMIIGVISLFTLSADYFTNAVLISFIYLLVGLPCVGSWLVFGVFLQRILKEEHHRRWFNTLMAGALMASIVMIWLE